MNYIRPASEAEMIRAFLAAEIDSTRFGGPLAKCAQALGIDLTVVTQADRNSAQEDRQRRALLGELRGYPDRLLFTGFPADVTWHVIQLEGADIETLRYARVEATYAIAGDGLLLISGAQSVQSDAPGATQHWGHVAGIRELVRAGRAFPPLIAAQMADGSLTLIEGHSRATAFVIEGAATGKEVILGRAHSFAGWPFCVDAG